MAHLHLSEGWRLSEDGAPAICYVKRLVRRTAGMVVLRQYNPAGDIEIEESKVKKIFRILTLVEVHGI